ncbi:MAG TPA: sigma-70 family RNA polymerase sigma factor [Tepidisphaeraceae bacterium]|nr:sigma-70 family RNA polymerase sigma factor [Tepidisphaeraceae bacterium]
MSRPHAADPAAPAPSTGGCQVSRAPGTVIRMPDEASAVGPAGTVAALNSSFVRERPALLAFVHGLVRDRPAAEEIVQEVWIRLAGAVRQGTDVRQPERWFRGVARNLVLHHFRSRRTARVIADSHVLRMVELAEIAFEERGSGGGGGGSGAAGEDPWATRRARLSECIEKLPEPSRAVRCCGSGTRTG